MPFRLRRDARRWFRDIEPHLSRDFDMFQMCLMAGLAASRTMSVKNEDTTVLLEHFPDEYRESSRLIVALFLAVELDRLGVRPHDRRQIHETVGTLIDPEAPSLLTRSGMRAMNNYSYAGYEEILEWFAERPRTFEGFFVAYRRRIEGLFAGFLKSWVERG